MSGSSPVRDEALRLLTAVLRGDKEARRKALEDLPKRLSAQTSLNDYRRHTGEYHLQEIKEAMDAVTASDQERVAAFAQELTRLEKPGAQSRSSSSDQYLEVPDLLRFSDPGTAEALLTRALKLDLLGISIESTGTRLLAASIALRNIDSLKKPLWSLVQTLDHGPLYEALSKKFPGGTDWERDNAREVYLLILIATDRTEEAARLLETRVQEAGNQALPIHAGQLNEMGRQGLGGKVLAFLQRLLRKNPSLPYWDTLIELSAQQNASAEALKLLRECLGRQDLSTTVRHRLQARLYKALLAADQRDEGTAVLRELVTNPPQSHWDGNTREGRMRSCKELASLGRLLGRQELVPEALNAAVRIVETGDSIDGDQTECVQELVKLLSAHQQAAKAEEILKSHLASLARAGPGEQNSSDTYDCLVLLMQLHDNAGRFAESLALLEQNAHWGAPDLAELPPSMTSTTPLLVLAGRALAETGLTEEARRVALHAVRQHPGDDDAYELLVRVHAKEPDVLLPLLDKLAKHDRFEERPLIWKARVLLDAGKTDEAEKTIRAAIAIDPSDGEQGKGDRMRAYAILAEVLEKKGDEATAKIMRGAVSAIRKSEDADNWWEAGLLSEAVRRYEAALLDFADAYCIQSRLALRYSEMGEFAKAEQHYIRAFELMPDSFGRVESHCFGCEGAFKSQRAQNAADKVFTLLASLPPVKAQVHYLLGYLRSAQNRDMEAADAYRQAVKTDPDYLNAWTNLARLASAVRMPREESENATLQIVRLDPAGLHSQPHLHELRDLRKLWDVLLQAEASLPAAETEPLLPLPASKAQLDSLSAEERRRLQRRSRSLSRREDPREELAKNPLVQAVVQLVEALH
ncbi:MAG: hypothetical protein ACO1TE_21380 [Prosthecobacter sp.]